MIQAIHILVVDKHDTKKAKFFRATNPSFEIERAEIGGWNREFVTCLANDEHGEPIQASYVVVDLETGVQIGAIYDTPEEAVGGAERLASNRWKRRGLEKQMKKIMKHFGRPPEYETSEL